MEHCQICGSVDIVGGRCQHCGGEVENKKFEYRRFKIIGTTEQKQQLEELLQMKKLSRDDLTLILHTMVFRDPHFDTLAQ